VESPARVLEPLVSRSVDWATLRTAGCENLVYVDSLESTNALARRVVAEALDGGRSPARAGGGRRADGGSWPR